MFFREVFGATLSVRSAFAFCAFLLCFGFACNSEDEAALSANPSDMVIKGFSFTLCEAGEQKLDVHSSEARMPQDQSLVFLKDVRIAQLQDGATSGTITASEGIYYLRENRKAKRADQDLVLKGKVVVKRPEGFSLSTDEALIQSKEKRLVAKSNSRFRVPLQSGGILEGRSMHLALDLLSGFDTVNLTLGSDAILSKDSKAPNRKNKSSVKILSDVVDSGPSKRLASRPAHAKDDEEK